MSRTKTKNTIEIPAIYPDDLTDKGNGSVAQELKPDHVVTDDFDQEAKRKIDEMEERRKAARPEEKPQESKAERFRRLGLKRVPKALKALRQIENLTNSAQYEWTEQQSQKVIDLLRKSIDRICDGFDGNENAVESFCL